MREKRDGCWGGGRFKIDFPGVVMAIDEDEGGQEELDDDDDNEAAIDDVGLLISHHMHIATKFGCLLLNHDHKWNYLQAQRGWLLVYFLLSK